MFVYEYECLLSGINLSTHAIEDFGIKSTLCLTLLGTFLHLPCITPSALHKELGHNFCETGRSLDFARPKYSVYEIKVW